MPPSQISPSLHTTLGIPWTVNCPVHLTSFWCCITAPTSWWVCLSTPCNFYNGSQMKLHDCFQPPEFSNTTILLGFFPLASCSCCVRFKTLMLAYKSKHGPTLTYLKALIPPHTLHHAPGDPRAPLDSSPHLSVNKEDLHRGFPLFWHQAGEIRFFLMSKHLSAPCRFIRPFYLLIFTSFHCSIHET